MNKNIIIGALILIVLLMVGWVLSLDRKEVAAIRVHQDSVLVARHDVKLIEARELALLSEIEAGRKREAEVTKKFERRIAVLNAKIRATVSETKWASVEELDSLRESIYGVSENDTLYAMPIDQARDALVTKAIQPMNDSLYSEVANRVIDLGIDLQNSRVECGAQIALKEEIHAADQVIIRNQDGEIKELRKQKRKAKFRVFLEKLGIGAGSAAVGFGAGKISR